MITALRTRWVTVSVATLLYWVTSQLLIAMVPIHMSALGLADLEIGGAVAARSVLPFVFAILAGQLSDRVGGQRLLVPSAVVMAATGPLHAVAASPWHFALAQAVFGLSSIGVWISLQAVITHAGAGATLRQHLALFTLAWGIGLAAGPVLGAMLYDATSFAVLSWTYSGLTLAIVGVSLAIPWSRAWEAAREASPAPALRMAVTELLGRPAIRSVLLSSFVTHYMNSIRTSFYPVALERSGVGIGHIGFLLSVMGATSLLVRAVFPLLLRRFRPGSVLIASTVAGVVAISATPALADLVLLAAAAVAIGSSMGLNPPITVELMARFSTARERGLSAGMRVTVNRFAQSVQPVVFGGMASILGLSAAFPLSGALLGGLTFAMVRSTRQVRTSGGVV